MGSFDLVRLDNLGSDILSISICLNVKTEIE